MRNMLIKLTEVDAHMLLWIRKNTKANKELERNISMAIQSAYNKLKDDQKNRAD